VVFAVLVGPKATKALRKMDRKTKTRIMNAVRELREQPERIGKRLTYTDYWSLRIGDYRVIYKIDRAGMKVVILFVGHRSTVYDNFSKIF
jgi:mRNA interferase RelE/StbE